MENRIETFATDIPDSPEVYSTDNVKNGEEMYDVLLRSFERDPNDRSLIPSVIDWPDLMWYSQMRSSDGVDGRLLHEFWSWLENS